MSWATFGKPGYIIKSHDIPISLNSKIYETCILPVATDGLETVTLIMKCLKKIRTAQRAVERVMLCISLRDYIIKEEIRRRAKVTDVVKRLAELKRQRAEHIAKQD